MVPLKYLDAVRDVLAHLGNKELANVEKAADAVIAAYTHGGAVHCAGIGHGNEGDFLNRAGGLAAVHPFSYSLVINDPVAQCLASRPADDPVDREMEAIHLAVRAGNLRKGDVMLVSSVSGRNRGPIELTLACRAKGLVVIAFTSLAYSARVASLHPSGRKLCEVADVVVDIGAPYGDAAVDVPGYDFKLLPVSGVAMTVAGWMIWGRVMEKMAANGNPPTVFKSANSEGGAEFVQKATHSFHQRGY